jgi:hypothetical protein
MPSKSFIVEVSEAIDQVTKSLVIFFHEEIVVTIVDGFNVELLGHMFSATMSSES